MGMGGQEIRQAFRALAGAPALSSAIVLILALGLGANLAVFSLVRQVLLAPLPYPTPERLVTLQGNPWIPVALFQELEQGADSPFDALGATYPQPFTLGRGEEPLEVEGLRLTPNALGMLGVETALPAWDGSPSVLAAEGLVAGGAPAFLPLDGTPHRLLGTAPGAFRHFTPRARHPRLWVPARFEARRADGSLAYIVPLVRLREGRTLPQAQAALGMAVARFLERHPEARSQPRWTSLRFVPLREALAGDFRPALLILQAAVGLLLLVACANVANLLMARMAARRHEWAVRTALGATPAKLLGQAFAEGLLLSLLAGAVAFLLLRLGLGLLEAWAPLDLPRLQGMAADAPQLLAALGLSALAALLFTLPLAALSQRGNPLPALQAGARTVGVSRQGFRLRQALLTAQVALTLVLLGGAGLLGRSFMAVLSRPLGFHPEGVYVLPLRIPETRFKTVEALEAHHRLLRQRLMEVPGIRTAAFANNPPSRRSRSSREIHVEGHEGMRVFHYAVVSPDYFRTLGIPLLRGREMEEGDHRQTPPVAVVDAAMAQALWPGEEPLGKRFRMEGIPQWVTVAGVAADTLNNGVSGASAPGFYLSHQQRPDTFAELVVGRQAVALLRSELPLATLAPALRQALREVDPALAVPDVLPLGDLLKEERGPFRFRALMMGSFALLALLLSAAGLYGMVAQLTGERAQELRLRQALGATPGEILRRVLGWGLGLAALGLLLGLGAALALGRLLSALLFRVPPSDPWTLGAAALAVIFISLAACLPPALGAARAPIHRP